MSHFTVIVTNTNDKSIDEQLERFYEQGDETDYFMERKIEVAHDEYQDYLEGKVKDYTGYIEEYEKQGNDDAVERWTRYLNEVKTASESDDVEVKQKYIGDNEGSMDEEGNFYYVTNPDAKWDWYQVGGRWAGHFIPKAGASGEKGTPSLLAGIESIREVATNNHVDVIKVSYIDWDAMEADIKKVRGEKWDKEQEEPVEKRWRWEFGKDRDALLLMSRDQYVNQDVDHSTFAVLHNDMWYERGEMGWWAMVSNEKEDGVWEKEWRKLIESLDPETEVTLVDCHI